MFPLRRFYLECLFDKSVTFSIKTKSALDSTYQVSMFHLQSQSCNIGNLCNLYRVLLLFTETFFFDQLNVN